MVSNIDEIIKQKGEDYNEESDAELIAQSFDGAVDSSDVCSANNLSMVSNVQNIPTIDTGGDNDYNPGF